MPKPTKRRRAAINPAGRAWVTARKVVQYILLAFFLSLFFIAQQEDTPASLVNLPMRLDPLTMLAHLLASRTWLAGSAVALLTLLLTLVFGRAWCGWICPLGTTLDLFSLKKMRGKRRPPAEAWRGVKYLLLTGTLTAALLGNLTLLAFDPLTLLYRALTTSIFPVIDRIVLALERLLVRIPFLAGSVISFDTLVRPAILPANQEFFQNALLFGGIFLGIILLNILAERFWCRYLCPLGGLLGLISKIAFFRRSVGQDCPGCVLCTAACPTGTIDPAKNYASDPAECTLCMDCLETCPRTRITFPASLPKPAWQAYDPDRCQFLLTAGAAAAAVALTRTGALARREPPFLLRPPGVREVNTDILSVTRCIRCAECIRVCPTNALQPGVFEVGVEGFGAPLLVPRLGYCDFSCNACGQVCPTQAIPPLSLEEKQATIIGKAYIDQDRCIAWADGVDCIICEEVCPVPEKAIWLGESQGQGQEQGRGRGQGNGNAGETGSAKLPHVDRERCIGCGICENKCPVNGTAAIRVYIPNIPAPF